MNPALYIAMAGAKSIMSAQTVRANNLANASTDGFRADFEQARSMPVYYGEGYSTRAFALTENPGTNFNFGPQRETGRDLDIAVEGEGWIAVQAPDGSEAYTRAGSLHIDSLGQLLTGNNLPVLGNGGPVALPPSEKVEIGSDGTITVQPQGQEATVLSAVDRIKLVTIPDDQLIKGRDGLLRTSEGGVLPPDGTVRVAGGFLEGSNVNVVDEMTNIMAMARQYEMQVKMMKTVDDNSSSATSLLRLS